MPVQTTLRLANIGDIDNLNRLVQCAYRGGKPKRSWTNEDKLVAGPRITQAELYDLIVNSDKEIIVAEQGDGLIGCVLVEKACSERAYIGLLSVDPDLQSVGLGGRLLAAAEDFARKSYKSKKSTMWILAGRSELLAWYKRMGYEETGETKPFLDPSTGVIALVDNLHFLVIEKDI